MNNENFVIPPPEMMARDIDRDELAPRSGIRQIVNLLHKCNWEVISIRRARGPYVGANGNVLSISDVDNVKARSVNLDKSIDIAVASWRDGKFDFAYIGNAKNNILIPVRVNASVLKKWIRRESSLGLCMEAMKED